MRTLKLLLLVSVFAFSAALHAAPSPPGLEFDVSKTIGLSQAQSFDHIATQRPAFIIQASFPISATVRYVRLKRNWRTLARNGKKCDYSAPPVNELMQPVDEDVIEEPDHPIPKRLHIRSEI